MGPNKVCEDLRTHSRFIRDYIAPNLAREDFSMTHSDHKILNSVFVSLTAAPITRNALRYSYIHKALLMITSGGLPWPTEYTTLAEALLREWEKKLGSLRDIRPDLHYPGGRLHGVRRLRDSGVGLEHQGTAVSYVTLRKPDLPRVHQAGDLGFVPGDWWLNTAAACRDGIIDDPNKLITANEKIAYALIVTRYEGPSDRQIISVDENGRFIYRMTKTEEESMNLWPAWTRLFYPGSTRGVHQLLRCMQYGGSPIRVLRAHTSQSWMAPRAGIRYDGLYRIRSYNWLGPRSEPGELRNDSVYSFLLHRVEENQLPFDQALRHPVSDEMDDWMEYRRCEIEDDGREIVRVLTAEMDAASLQVKSPSPRPKSPRPRSAGGIDDYFSLAQNVARAKSPLHAGADPEDDEAGSTTPKARDFDVRLTLTKGG